MQPYSTEQSILEGDIVKLDDGVEMQRQRQLRSRQYFSVFGKFDVPRTYYHTKGQEGVFLLDAAANLPERCYSYLLQEWMNLCSVREHWPKEHW